MKRHGRQSISLEIILSRVTSVESRGMFSKSWTFKARPISSGRSQVSRKRAMYLKENVGAQQSQKFPPGWLKKVSVKLSKSLTGRNSPYRVQDDAHLCWRQVRDKAWYPYLLQKQQTKTSLRYERKISSVARIDFRYSRVIEMYDFFPYVN